MTYTPSEVKAAFQAKAKSVGSSRYYPASGWESMGWGSEGTVEALILHGEPVIARWVAGSDLDDNPGYSSVEIWVVIEIAGQFFKKTGYHSSEEGVRWDGAVTEVHPQTKTVTVYE